MKIGMDYEDSKFEIDIPQANLLHLAENEPVPPVMDPLEKIRGCLADPIGCASLKERMQGKKNVCIVISDSTRAVPTKLILEALLPEIESYGMQTKDITILIATGLHRPNVGAELEGLVGKDIMAKYRILNHNARDRESCVELGATKRGTPIIINKAFADADFKILTGLIEPHFMAGFSGGRKAVCPGISYMDMFKHFHGPAILESPNAANALLQGNPFHEESTEIAKIAGADFIVNVTINKHKQITGIFCGELDAAFYKGADFCAKHNSYKIKAEADIVITSGGGLPLDATLYQTVKGMVTALPAVKKGGMILSISGCREEIGSDEFVELMTKEQDLALFMEKIKGKDYFMIDQWELEELVKARKKADIYLYSPCMNQCRHVIPETTLKLVGSVQEALETGFKKYGKDATITVIPEGPYLIPVIS
jgi:lactate racemase